MTAHARLALGVLCALSCGGGAPVPAALDTRNDACTWCRMTVSDRRFAAQLVAPSEEARFFDDIGCLRAWLAGNRAPADGVAYVADHRTKEWIPASRAVYTRQKDLGTPMTSHLIAHADASSRDRDPDARGGEPVEATAIFGAAGPPGAGGPGR